MGIDKINFNDKDFSEKLRFDSQAPKLGDEIACFKNVLKDTEIKTQKEEPPVLKYAVPRDREIMVKYAMPDYYLPKINRKEEDTPIEKYALPPEDIVEPMYAVPPVNIEKKDNEPPVLEYSIPE